MTESAKSKENIRKFIDRWSGGEALNPEIRRSGGMHYTLIENTHKVIGSLFLSIIR